MGTLAAIRSQEQNNDIADLLKAANGVKAWVGGMQIQKGGAPWRWRPGDNEEGDSFPSESSAEPRYANWPDGDEGDIENDQTCATSRCLSINENGD